MDIFMPNVPHPINGMIKLYKNETRTFTRPYSAKNVFFYKEGDDYFQGVRVPVSKARYRNMEALMDELNSKIPLDFGVRRVCTPNGKTPIESVNELKHLGRYICASTNRQWTKNWELNAVLNKQTRMHNISRVPSQTESFYSPSQAAIRNKENYKKLMTTSTPPLKSSYLPRQILFVLQKDQERVYRSLLRPTRLPSMDALLTEISQSFNVSIYKMFTFEGRKILTVEELLEGITKVLVCQRHETPFSESNRNRQGGLRFPPIPRGGHVASNVFQRTAPKSTGIKGDSRTSSGNDTVSSIELPPLAKTNYLEDKRKSRQKRIDNDKDIDKDMRRKIKRTVEPHPSHGKAFDRDAQDEYNQIKKIKKVKKLKRKGMNSSEHDEAANKIQAAVRGYLVRKEIENEKKAAAKIQSHVKNYLDKKRKKADEERALSEKDKNDMHKSAVLLQTAFRGRRTRNRIKPADIHNEHSQPSFEEELHANFKEDVVDAKKLEAVVVTIQSAFRGYKVRKQTKAAKQPVKVVEKDGSNTLLASVKEVYPKEIVKPMHKVPKVLTYSVSVFTGNRWAAGTEADIYIKLHGENGVSNLLWLRQSVDDPKFNQGQLDTFDVETPYLGNLYNLTVGHNAKGYGAGIFLDRIIVTDMMLDKRQYVFFCNKWIDDDQVDRKLERTLKCAGFYDLDSMPDELANFDDTDSSVPISNGNWTITITTGDDPKAGTSSNVFLTAYGTINQSQKTPLDSEKFQYPGSVAEFEIEFGVIGDLYKIRLEIDGSGEAPHWFMDFVQMKDRDTGEQVTLNCKRWLGGAPSDAATSIQYQLFCELPMIRIGVEPMPVLTYSMKVTPSDVRGAQLPGLINVQLIGEYGESGFHSIQMPQTNGGPVKDMEFSVECVMLGRLLSIDFSIPSNKSGDEFSEGFATLQQLWDKQGIRIPIENWLVRKAVVRDSLHAPYHFVLSDSRIISSVSDNRIRKQLMLSDIEGLSTRTKGNRRKVDSNWLGTFWTGDQAHAHATGTPSIVMYGEKAKSKPIHLKSEGNFSENSAATCELHTGKVLGLLYKIRLSISPLKSSKSKANWFIRKLKLKQSQSDDEFSCGLDSWLDEDMDLEIPVIWPDVPPPPNVIYQCTVFTDSKSTNDTNFVPFLEIIGEKGDTGPRKLMIASSTKAGATFKPGNIDTFEIEAVTVRTIKKLRVGIDMKKYAKSDWFINRIEILDPQLGYIYIFKYDNWLSKGKGMKHMEVILDQPSTRSETEFSEE